MKTRKKVAPKEDENKRRKFERRSQKVLKETYKTREETSSSFGKNIFKDDALPEYIPKDSNELFIAPLGFEADTGFHVVVPIHFAVGPAQDRFVCRQRLIREACPICEDHSIKNQRWREAGGKASTGGEYPDVLKALFPSDRACYIVLDMANEETMEEGWQLLHVGKVGTNSVHSEITKRTHAKREGSFIDISDLEEGRIVYYEKEIVKTPKGSFPRYSGYELLELEEPIPDELVDKLADIIEEGEGYPSTIHQFLHIPSYEEVAASHLAGRQKGLIGTGEEEEGEPTEEGATIDEDAIRAELEGMNKLKIKKVVKSEYGIVLDIKGKTAEELVEEAVEAITGVMEEEGEASESNVPKCFGNAYTRDECENCSVVDECAVETGEE